MIRKASNFLSIALTLLSLSALFAPATGQAPPPERVEVGEPQPLAVLAALDELAGSMVVAAFDKHVALTTPVTATYCAYPQICAWTTVECEHWDAVNGYQIGIYHDNFEYESNEQMNWWASQVFDYPTIMVSPWCNQGTISAEWTLF